MNDTLHEIQRKEQEADEIIKLCVKHKVIFDLFGPLVNELLEIPSATPLLGVLEGHAQRTLDTLIEEIGTLMYHYNSTALSLRSEARSLRNSSRFEFPLSIDPDTTGGEK
jgi:hypothetical protein